MCINVYSKAAKEAVQRGELVSDQIITDLIVKEIEKRNDKDDDDSNNHGGYLLDGYPRTSGM